MWKSSTKVLMPASEYFGIGPSQFRDLIQQYDVLCLDLDEALRYTGLASCEEAIQWFASNRTLCTVITLGEHGAICILDDVITRTEPARLSQPVIDTMGCGDVFAASFVHSFVRSGRDVRGSLKNATLHARCKTTIDGMWYAILDARKGFEEIGAGTSNG
jgi:sugar/nucleoside kinase (ribokinase family)